MTPQRSVMGCSYVPLAKIVSEETCCYVSAVKLANPFQAIFNHARFQKSK